jgi:hypothetical protein
MTNAPAPRTRSRLSGDDGSVIAEMALVAPLMVLLMLGVFEFGTAWRNKVVLTNSLRSAGRIESQNSTNPNVDQLALGAFYAGNSKLTNMTLVRVIIYDAAGAAGAPPANCLSISPVGLTTKGVKNSGGTNSCSVYSPAQVVAAAANGGTFGSCTVSSSWDFNYCAGTAGIPDPRQNSLTATGGPDYVGVYAEYTYDTMTGLLPGNTLKITDQVVYRIEPAAA